MWMLSALKKIINLFIIFYLLFITWIFLSSDLDLDYLPKLDTVVP